MNKFIKSWRAIKDEKTDKVYINLAKWLVIGIVIMLAIIGIRFLASI